MGYLGNFIVYTLAMVGVIVVALLVVKNSTSFGSGAKSKYLKVLDSMSLGPRKTLYIVSTGREKFLIAGDADRTSLISKLESSEDCIISTIQENASCVPSPRGRVQTGCKLNSLPQYPLGGRDVNGVDREGREGASLNPEVQVKTTPPQTSFQQTMSHLSKTNYMDRNIGINSSMLHKDSNSSVLRNMLQNLK